MKILHVLRAPIGGLFRHVVDLAAGQIERGHDVGIIADGRRAPDISENALAGLAPRLALGLCRIPIDRKVGPFDVVPLMRVARQIHTTGAEIAHGHGAKGGALARLAPAAGNIVRVYTPHGGSLHQVVGGWSGIQMERVLKQCGQLYLFESLFSHDLYLRKVGRPAGLMRVVHNGIRSDEFSDCDLAARSSDIVYLGEMRTLKGVDVLIDALAKLHGRGHRLTAVLIGDGPDATFFRCKVRELDLDGFVKFRNSMPTREALSLGRIVVMPSRAESLPYVVLESLAAGKLLVATNVGGITEIFGPYSDCLVPPDDVDALVGAITELAVRGEQPAMQTAAIRSRLKELFSVENMVDSVLESYRRAQSEFGRRSRFSAPVGNAATLYPAQRD